MLSWKPLSNVLDREDSIDLNFAIYFLLFSLVNWKFPNFKCVFRSNECCCQFRIRDAHVEIDMLPSLHFLLISFHFLTERTDPDVFIMLALVSWIFKILLLVLFTFFRIEIWDRPLVSVLGKFAGCVVKSGTKNLFTVSLTRAYQWLSFFYFYKICRFIEKCEDWGVWTLKLGVCFANCVCASSILGRVSLSKQVDVTCLLTLAIAFLRPLALKELFWLWITLVSKMWNIFKVNWNWILCLAWRDSCNLLCPVFSETDFPIL